MRAKEEFDKMLDEVLIPCGRLAQLPKGKVFIGGCRGPIKIMEVYACVDCSAPFHRKCLLKHIHEEMLEDSLTKIPLEEAFIRIDEIKPESLDK